MLIHIIMQIVIIIGAVYIVGFLINILNKTFYKLLNYNKPIVYITGIIGTPIHELSHAFICMVFFHKIKKIKFFQLPKEDGVMGYVEHTYNKKNIYHLIGCFFISVAPIFIGSLIIYLLIRVMLPNAFSEINEYLELIIYLENSSTSYDSISYLVNILGEVFVCILSYFKTSFWWFIFMIMALPISLHMRLSAQDIKESYIGIPFIALLIVILNVIFGFIFSNLYFIYLNSINTICGFTILMLLIALSFSIIFVIISLLIKLIIISFKLLKNNAFKIIKKIVQKVLKKIKL